MFDMNNPSSWGAVWNSLKNKMGVIGKTINDLSDTAFEAYVAKTIQDASRQYRSLTGARHVSPDSERMYNEDKLRLESTEKHIENMLTARPLSYDPKLFTNWYSDNKCAILLRAQSNRSTPLCTHNQNVFHVLASEYGEFWLREWYKNKMYMPTHVTAHWLNELSDQNETPLQMFWEELCGELKLHAQNINGSILRCEYLDAITDATIMVLHNDWGVLNDQSPKSITQYWDAIKSDNEIRLLYPRLFEEIQAVITHKNITDILGEQKYTPSKRKI